MLGLVPKVISDVVGQVCNLPFPLFRQVKNLPYIVWGQSLGLAHGGAYKKI